jgi:BirA family transcriptional regulator, biotin operon repressor / biotin---[acetyl-CoA-carboxylase] ligase
VLPPGFRALPGEGDAWRTALRAAALGVEPGAVFWDGAHGRCRAAFVFAPDRPLGDGSFMLDLGALALFDAVAVLAPPQVPVHILPPDGLAVDGGRVATIRMAMAPCREDAIPEWAVLEIEVAIQAGIAAPGEAPDQTCLMEEGFGDVTAADVLMHGSRYLLGWLDEWREGGAAALAQAVALRTTTRAVAA